MAIGSGRFYFFLPVWRLQLAKLAVELANHGQGFFDRNIEASARPQSCLRSSGTPATARESDEWLVSRQLFNLTSMGVQDELWLRSLTCPAAAVVSQQF